MIEIFKLILEIIILISLLGFFHSYIFFPLILKIITNKRKFNHELYALKDENLPIVSILLAVYNEEKVIEEKIKSTFNTHYPLHKIQLIIGSDASTDKTNSIILLLQKEYPNQIIFKNFDKRTGKVEIINQISTLAKGEIFILTDANVFFNPDTIFQLVKHFKFNEMGIVGGNIINPKFKPDGISFQEKAYLTRENIIKYQEGIWNGNMVGAFGGCYAVRASLYTHVPHNTLVDDFYISMAVKKQNKWVINELEAACYEDVSNKIEEEFRRKIRISIGNFQNLKTYRDMAFNILTPFGFCFFSHKVLRWYFPFLMIVTFLASIILVLLGQYWALMLILVFLGGIWLIFVDNFFKYLGFNFSILRFNTHFFMMNLALLLGYFKYKNKNYQAFWKPTERNQ